MVIQVIHHMSSLNIAFKTKSSHSACQVTQPTISSHLMSVSSGRISIIIARQLMKSPGYRMGCWILGNITSGCFFSGHVSRPSPYQQSALAGEKADSTHLILAWSTVFCLVIRLLSLERIAICLVVLRHQRVLALYGSSWNRWSMVQWTPLNDKTLRSFLTL